MDLRRYNCNVSPPKGGGKTWGSGGAIAQVGGGQPGLCMCMCMHMHMCMHIHVHAHARVWLFGHLASRWSNSALH